VDWATKSVKSSCRLTVFYKHLHHITVFIARVEQFTVWIHQETVQQISNLCKPNTILTTLLDVHHVRKNITDIFDCNVKKLSNFNNFWQQYFWHNRQSDDCPIFHCTHCLLLHYLGNKTNKILHFYPISPVRVFPHSANGHLMANSIKNVCTKNY